MARIPICLSRPLIIRIAVLIGTEPLRHRFIVPSPPSKNLTTIALRSSRQNSRTIGFLRLGICLTFSRIYHIQIPLRIGNPPYTTLFPALIRSIDSYITRAYQHHQVQLRIKNQLKLKIVPT